MRRNQKKKEIYCLFPILGIPEIFQRFYVPRLGGLQAGRYILEELLDSEW